MIFLIATISLTWSLVTPIWHGPDEYEHFIYADILARQNTLPENRNYVLPFSLTKSTAVSHYPSYFNHRRFIYEGDTNPFEEKVDSMIDPIEAGELFASLPVRDLDPVSIDFKASVLESPGMADKPTISIPLSYMKTLIEKWGGVSFLIYGVKYQGEEKYKVAQEKSEGYLFIGKKLVKALSPNGEAMGIPQADGAITFTRESGGSINFKLIPIQMGQKEYYPRSYKYAPFYYLFLAGILKLTALFKGGLISSLFFCRLFSVALLLLALPFVYKTFSLIWPGDDDYALAGVTLFALWPMNSFMFGTVNTANMLILFSTASFYFITKILFSKARSDTDWILLSVTASLAAFSKVTGFLIIAVWWTLLMITLIFFKKEKFRPVFVLPLVLMILGPYLMWFHKHGFARGYGVPADLSVMQYIDIYLAGGFKMLFKSFAGNFGYLRHEMPAACYIILAAFTAVISAMFLYGIFKGFKKEERINCVYMFLCTLLSVLFFFAMEFININKVGIVIMGRYFFFLLLPIFVMAWSALINQTDERLKRTGKAVGFLFAAAVAMINGVSLIYYMTSNFAL